MKKSILTFITKLAGQMAERPEEQRNQKILWSYAPPSAVDSQEDSTEQ